MVTLFRKLFIKKYSNTSEQTVREKHGFLASIVSLLLNLILVVIKLCVGLLSNSISIIGDAVNNIADMLSGIISLFGFKISSKPADKDHPFGHQRMEYVSSLIISIVIIVVSIEVFSSSINKIIYSTTTTYSYITIIVLIISILLKLYLSYFNFKISKLINSLSLKAVAKDSRNDAISTFVILISTIISMILNINLDGYMGVIVAIFIFISGINMVRETVSVLIGEAADKELVDKILKDINNEEYILGIHDVMCHTYGPTKIFMSLHAEVDSSLNILFIHEIIDNVEFLIKEKYGVHLVIHMDPVNSNCDTTNDYKDKVISIVKELSPLLNIHDFRAVIAEGHINLVFDISKPYDLKLEEEFIESKLDCLLNTTKVKVNLIIRFISDFS